MKKKDRLVFLFLSGLFLLVGLFFIFVKVRVPGFSWKEGIPRPTKRIERNEENKTRKEFPLEKNDSREEENTIKRKSVRLSPGNSALGSEMRFLRVRVLRKDGKKLIPFAGAKVLLEKNFYGSNEGEEFEIQNKIGPPGNIKDSGKQERKIYYTNEKGIAFIRIKPRHKGYFLNRRKYRLWAKSETGTIASNFLYFDVDSNGEAWVWNGSTPYKLPDKVDLVLFPQPALEFVVLNDNGHLVPNVPVGLFHFFPGLYYNSNRVSYFLALKGTSGEKGVGRIENVYSFLRWYHGNEKKIKYKEWALGFIFPLGNYKKRFYKISKEILGKEPIKMILPSTGKVVARLVGPGGNILPQMRGWAALRWAKKKGVVWDDHWANGPCGFSRVWIRRNSVQINDGIACFPFVGLNIKLQLLVVVPGIVKFLKKEINGPSFPGEKVNVILPLISSDPIVRVRLFGENGGTIKNSVILVKFSSLHSFKEIPNSSMGDFSEKGKTDSSGRLAIPLPPRFAEGRIKEALLISLDKQESPYAFKILPLPKPFEEGTIDLGNIVLNPFPLVCSGVVEWENNGPAFNALVQFLRPRIRHGKKEWVPVWRVWTDRKGRFVLKNIWNWNEVRVIGSMEDGTGYSEVKDLVPGARGVKLVLKKTCLVNGNVLVDRKEWIESGLINIYMRAKVGKDNYHISSKIDKTVTPDGRFSFERVPVGVYDFYVTNGFWPGQKIFFLPGIKVYPRENKAFSNLKNIDLRGLLEEADVEICKENGDPFSSFEYFDLLSKSKYCNLPIRLISSYELKAGLIKIKLLKKSGSSPWVTFSMSGFEEKKFKIDFRHKRIILRKKK